MRRILFFTLLLAPAFSQAQIDSINVLKPAAVKAVSSDERSPFAHTNISEQEISDRDAAQDLPFLIRFAPSVVVTSDAGNGIGYTGMRLRGTDATRINVTINGVPLNDAESMGVWWVDLPDLGSSISDLQISRGVGTSTNGPGAFGGSIAINTLGKVAEPMIQAKVGFGSFNSRRQSAMWNSGINEKGLSFDGRVSKITSDGYVNRASSELFSLYGSLTKRWETGKISLTAMNGEERTYQSWYGVPEIVTQEGVSDSTILNWAYGSYDYGYGADTARVNDLITNGRQHNYYNYADEVDDYTQTHHQLHVEQALGKANLGFSLFQTLGQGYFENQIIGADPLGFGLTQNNTPGDFVIRRWLDNTLRGGMFNFQREFGKLNVDFGGMYSNYVGDHFGRLLEVDTAYANMPDDSTYYSSVGDKSDFSQYMRMTWLSESGKLRVQGEIQRRAVNYTTAGTNNDFYALTDDNYDVIYDEEDNRTPVQSQIDINDEFKFLNPKFGFDFKPNSSNRFFSSIAIANREPSRGNYLDAPDPTAVRPEKLTDIEVGYRFSKPNFAFELGLYQMDYENQLIPTGAINETGAAVQMNVTESYRRGIEIQAGFNIGKRVTWQGNLTLSENKIADFSYYVDDYWWAEDSLGNAIPDPDSTYSYAINVGESDIAFSPSIVGASILNIDLWEGGELFSNEQYDVDLEFASKYVGEQFTDNTSNELRKLPAYLVHDVVLRCNMTINDKEVGLSLFANNVLNHMYSANAWSFVNAFGTADNLQSTTFVYPQAGRNGFVSLSVKF